jgi:hypothetical protein
VSTTRTLIPAYAILAAIAYLLYAGQVAPCLGLDNSACIADWQAQRTVLDRLLDTPVPYTLAFLIASGITLAIQRTYRKRTT